MLNTSLAAEHDFELNMMCHLLAVLNTTLVLAMPS